MRVATLGVGLGVGEAEGEGEGDWEAAVVGLGLGDGEAARTVVRANGFFGAVGGIVCVHALIKSSTGKLARMKRRMASPERMIVVYPLGGKPTGLMDAWLAPSRPVRP